MPILNSNLAKQIREHWIADQNHPHRDRTKRDIPSEDIFATMLDTCFEASLKTEEGGSIRGAVTWLSPDELANQEIPRRRATALTLQFDKPVSFEPKVLAKLNRISNGFNSTLLATSIDGQPMVWGLLTSSSPLRPLSDIPTGGDLTRHFSPDAPMVTITGIGSLRISRADTVIGRVEHGRFLPAEPTALMSTGALPFFLALVGIYIPEHENKYSNANDAVRGPKFIHAIEFLISTLAQRGEGATIVFLPPGTDVPLPYESGYQCSGTLEIDLLLEESNRVANQFEAMLYAQKIAKSLRERISLIAGLGGVDGAVIVDSSYRPRSFGVKLKADKWNGPVVERTPYGKAPIATVDFSRLGTRHHSALDFIGSTPGSIAIVASEDGPIRLLARNKDEVWYWPDCRLSMFV